MINNYTISKNIGLYGFGGCSISNQNQVKSIIGIKSSNCHFSSFKNNSFKSSFSISKRIEISFQDRIIVSQSANASVRVLYSSSQMKFQKRLSKQASIGKGFKSKQLEAG